MEALRVWRKALGLTIQQVQQRVPPTRNGTMMPHSQWSKAERRGILSGYRQLEKYGQALNVNLGQLFGIQALIEDHVRAIGAFDVDSNYMAVIQEFARQRGITPDDAIPSEPGPIIFQLHVE